MFSLCPANTGNGDLSNQGGPENYDMSDNRGKQTPVTKGNKQIRAVTKENKQSRVVTKGNPQVNTWASPLLGYNNK